MLKCSAYNSKMIVTSIGPFKVNFDCGSNHLIENMRYCELIRYSNYLVFRYGQKIFRGTPEQFQTVPGQRAGKEPTR